MGAFYGELDFTNATGALQALVLGPQTNPSMTIGQVADSILVNSESKEDVIVDLVNREVQDLADGTNGYTVAAVRAAINSKLSSGMTATDFEVFTIPTGYEEKRSMPFETSERTRSVTGTSGDALFGGVLDPALPSSTLPTLLNKLEDAGGADIIMISQADPFDSSVGPLQNEEGVILAFGSTAWAEMVGAIEASIGVGTYATDFAQSDYVEVSADTSPTPIGRDNAFE